jgi:uncharacterized membrane protein YphA (DoxX/SURF4 family)
MMKQLRECEHWARSHTDAAIDLVRVYLGLGLIVKAIFFWAHRPELIHLVQTAGDHGVPPLLLAKGVIGVHLVGGLLLAIGLFTRLAALVQMPILMGAVYYLYLPGLSTVESRQMLEFTALVLFLLLLLVINGAGRWSVDQLIRPRVTRQGDAFMDLVRSYLGVGLFIKAVFIMSHETQFLQMLDSAGPMWFAPVLVMHFVLPAHLAGGLLLATGLLSRLAAAVQVPILLGAMVFLQLPYLEMFAVREGLEFTGLVLFLVSLIAFFGPGRWSVDHLLEEEEHAELQPQAHR